MNETVKRKKKPDKVARRFFHFNIINDIAYMQLRSKNPPKKNLKGI